MTLLMYKIKILPNRRLTTPLFCKYALRSGERGGSVVECRTPEREVRGSRPTAAVLCPWARHFTPRKYWLLTQEAMAPSRHDWKIVDWDVKPQHNQPTNALRSSLECEICTAVEPFHEKSNNVKPACHKIYQGRYYLL